jgi:outer membrane protein OmpA-like peptidoglycan-associated protein
LEKDSLYKVEISLCLDKESNTAVNNFSILFSQSSLRSIEDSKFFTLKPQIEFNFSYTDSSYNWITLQSFYKANGNEKYLVIGNLRTDKTTTTRKITSVFEKGKKKKWDLDSGEKASYYYIDDVIVKKIEIIDQSKELSKKEEEVLDSLNINDIRVDSAIILRNIIFDFNKWDLLPASFNELIKLYNLMAKNPTIKIKLEGHTDNIGSYDYNLQLSLRRVESVAIYLIEKGINPNRIELAGYSFAYPIASNITEEGRKTNRRVVFKIIQK